MPELGRGVAGVGAQFEKPSSIIVAGTPTRMVATSSPNAASSRCRAVSAFMVPPPVLGYRAVCGRRRFLPLPGHARTVRWSSRVLLSDRRLTGKQGHERKVG